MANLQRLQNISFRFLHFAFKRTEMVAVPQQLHFDPQLTIFLALYQALIVPSSQL